MDVPGSQLEAFRYGNTISVRAATWDFNPKNPRENFTEVFRRKPVTAMRDFASIPLVESQGFFKNPDVLDTNANHNRHHPLS